MHLGIDHRSYKHHKVSAALMLIVLTLFEVASLLPLSANLFAVVGEPSLLCYMHCGPWDATDCWKPQSLRRYADSHDLQ